MCAKLSSVLSYMFKLRASHVTFGALILWFCVGASHAHYFHIEPQHQYQQRAGNGFEQREPSEVMVDLTNDLAYRVLDLHSFLNRNNFAFSPTALMCVMVALFEGSAGRSSLEIRNALRLPSNREVMRVGYRDIHRRLRTYFFLDENPLKGLSLNKENVTITAKYETILKFYGYDLGIDMVSSTVMPEITSFIEETETSTLPSDDKTTTPSMNSIETTTVTEKLPTTMEPMMSTTLESEEVTTLQSTTEAPTEKPETTTQQPQEYTESSEESMKEKANLKKSDKLRSPSPSRRYLPTKLASTKRNRRHLFGLKDLDASFFLNVFPPRPQFLRAAPPPTTITIEALPPLPPIHVAEISPVEGFDSLDPLNPIDGTIPLLRVKNAFGHYDVEEQFLPASVPGSNKEVVSHIFYLNNQEVVHATFKVYNSVLYYKYLDHLKITVLELELDSTEYNLMILLPDYDVDLQTAASSLRSGPTLRVLRKQLKPRWVQATIPDFKLQGTMFLTNDLQNMGICDVFEPRRADFRPMTDESDIYVKHIEQAINVSIRTRPINHLKRSHGPQTRPIRVSVNYPFMFFIIDRDLDVATIAGRVLNPLNVRIQ